MTIRPTAKSCLLILASASLVLGCNRSFEEGEAGYGGESSLSEVRINLPDRARFGDKADALSGYRLIIEPLTRDCGTPTEIERVSAWQSQPLAAKLVQGCDYSVGLELGSLTDDRVAPVFFSNYEGSGRGDVLKAVDFAGKAQVNMSLRLALTEEGEKAGFGVRGGGNGRSGDLILDLGVNPTPTPSVSPGEPPRNTPTPRPGDTPTPTPTPTPSPDPSVSPPPPGSGGADFGRVEPIFKAHCSECHHPGNDLDLTRFPFVAKGFASDRAVMDKVMERVRASGSDLMPPRPRDILQTTEIDRLEAFRTSL